MDTLLEGSKVLGKSTKPNEDQKLRIASYVISLFWLIVGAYHIIFTNQLSDLWASASPIEAGYDLMKQALFILWLLVSCLLSGRRIKVGYIGLGVASIILLSLGYLIFTSWMIAILNPVSFFLVLPLCLCFFGIALLHFYLLVNVL
jgi:hypothetical protein